MAGLSCGSKCAKYTLFFFNLLFWLAGAAVLGISIWLLVDGDAVNFLKIIDIEGTSEELIKTAAILLCVVGSIVFLAGFLGCCGAIRESTCMLVMYATIVVILLLAQITAGILAVVFKDQILNNLETSMNRTVIQYYGRPGHAEESDAWDIMQKTFKCCGTVEPYDEWQLSYWYANVSHGDYNVPPTCCVLEDEFANPPVPVNYRLCSTEAKKGYSGGHYYGNGCYKSLEKWVKDHAAILIGVAFGLAATQLLAIIVACCVRSAINSSRKDRYRTT